MATAPNVPRLQRMLSGSNMPKITVSGSLTSNGTVTCTGSVNGAALTVTGIQKHVNASGSYINGHNTTVKSVSISGSDTELRSGPIHLPPQSLIRDITVVVTTAISGNAAATYGIRAGTAENNASLITLDVDSLATAGSTVSAGTGSSTNRRLAGALGGAALLVMNTGSMYYSTDGEVHVEVQPSTDILSSGSVSFIVDWDYLGGN